MTSLSKENFARARHAIMSEGRPLEQALFRHDFESSSADEAIAELAKYQNADGGFGNGLEPDAQTPASSALHSAMGLRMLRELGRNASEPMVQRTVRYLLDSYDPAGKVWPIMPPAVNDAPHAPWWESEGDSLAQGFGGFRLNPRAIILAQLWHYAALVPADWLNQVTEDTVNAYEKQPADWHDLLCAVGLADEPALPQHYRARLSERVRELAANLIQNNPAAWAEYGGQPLTAAAHPDSLLASDYRAELEQNIDYMIAQQGADGSWVPNWSWFGNYPEAWEHASRAWSGFLTLENLRALRAYGRIEE